MEAEESGREAGAEEEELGVPKEESPPTVEMEDCEFMREFRTVTVTTEDVDVDVDVDDNEGFIASPEEGEDSSSREEGGGGGGYTIDSGWSGGGK